MKKTIFIMMIFLFSGIAFIALAHEQSDVSLVSAEISEKSDKAAYDLENKKTASQVAETETQIRAIKIAIFACGFIISGILWRKLSKYLEKRDVRGHQGIRKRLR